MLDTATLRQAYDDLLDAARRTADPEASTAPPPGEWNPDQVLAHVSMINATTIATAYTVASGLHATYDNRVAHDPWSIRNTVALAGGGIGLRARIACQADVLCALGDPALSETELDAPVPARLVSNGALVVDQVLTLRDLINGLAESEIPGHAKQLLALLA